MNYIGLTINGKPFRVESDDIPVNTSLNTFIRNHAHLKGTKSMCLEGGCGVCIVTVKRIQPFTKNLETFAVNSCLMPVYACHDVDVITIEGLGNKKDGYSPEQTRLLERNGSQCGFCSPGMIMNMHSLLERAEGNLTMENIENSFGGNICRCTGYRPILDAFKSFAIDADETLLCNDIEDLPTIFTGRNCGGLCRKELRESLHLQFKDGIEWYKVYTIDEILKILKDSTSKPYMLLSGNTAHGVFRRSEELKLFIDINDVSDLRSHSIVDNELVVGANNNLTETMKIFTVASKTPGFEYCIHLAKHIDLMANVPVRNIGTIAGNLSIKHQHNRFQSDLFIILEGVGAKMTIVDVNGKMFSVSIAKYLTVDMTKKVIVDVKLPMIDPTLFKFRSYKIMLRAQNSEAYVNAAFRLKFQGNTVDSASICFGGINDKFIHANDTEMILRGKNLYTNETLQLAMKVLKNEVRPDEVMPFAAANYRQKLAVSLFYKFVLNTCKKNLIKPEYRRGGNILERSLSSGTQIFDTRTDEYPLTEPITKYDGLAQVSGNAVYTNDVANQHNELWAAFVPATKVHYKIGKIDATESLNIPGVRFFYSAEDVPGKNSFTTTSLLGIVEDEEIFVGYNSEVLYYGQPVGVILADTFTLANSAAAKVKISYAQNDSYMALARTLFTPWFGEKKVLSTIQDVFNTREKYEENTNNSESTSWGTSKLIKGRMVIPGQYHMHMEPQTTVCIPDEDGILVYTATQWIDFTNVVVAECLKVPENSIHIVVHRLGGGYGGKVTRSAQIACACALACHLTGLPIRFVMSLESNMTVIGKRNGMIGEYEVEVDGNGKIEKFSSNSAHDMGCSLNESPTILASIAYPNCYDATLWQVKSENVKTDAPSHTWCRAPGTLESIALAETIMEHISKVIGKDPISVRLANISSDSYMKTLIPNFLRDVEFENRKKKVDEFNKTNRWNKRGIAVVPMKYPILYFNTHAAYVCIYHYDGTVIIGHGGIEMGQGINTKIAQIAAYTLGIPYTFIKVRPTNNVIGGNCMVTGGSMTSEMVCFAVKKACEEILGRLKPIREEKKNASWVDITKAAYSKHIDLSTKYTAKAEDLKAYDVWGLSCAEIETDVLTGNIQLLRVDILEDAGESMNPLIDIGQIEGAFIMGVGYWLTENLIYDRMNGELLTNRTWNYKPPGAKDIPIDFRIKLLPKNPNTVNVLRSKAVGEPAIAMSIVVTFALRYALESARSDAGITNSCWFTLPTPATPEVIASNAGHSTDSFSI